MSEDANKTDEYWINPKTGEKYCIDNRATPFPASYGAGASAGMTQLPPYYGKSYAGHIPLQTPPIDAIV